MSFWELLTTGEVMGDSTRLVPPQTVALVAHRATAGHFTAAALAFPHGLEQPNMMSKM